MPGNEATAGFPVDHSWPSRWCGQARRLNAHRANWGIINRSPSFIADWWAMMPGTVMASASSTFTSGSRFSRIAGDELVHQRVRATRRGRLRARRAATPRRDCVRQVFLQCTPILHSGHAAPARQRRVRFPRSCLSHRHAHAASARRRPRSSRTGAISSANGLLSGIAPGLVDGALPRKPRQDTDVNRFPVTPT